MPDSPGRRWLMEVAFFMFRSVDKYEISLKFCCFYLFVLLAMSEDIPAWWDKDKLISKTNLS